MKILVAGGAGYIGSHMVRALLDAGHHPVTFDNLSRGHRDHVQGGAFVHGDLGDRSALDALFRAHRIDAVMHFSAFASVAESIREPFLYYRNNVAHTLVLLQAMRDAGVNRLVFSSSAAVYGNPQERPIHEEHPLVPINPYGRTKLMAEGMLQDFHAAYGLRYAILRYFNAAGASADALIGETHDPETHLIPNVLSAALGRIPHLEICGTDYPTPDGTCIRDYIHVEDLAEAHLLALNAVDHPPKGGASPGGALVYNLGTGHGHSVREIVTAAEAATGKKIPRKETARRPGDPPVLVASCDRAKKELGWNPRRSDLKTILATAWAWAKRL